MAIVFIPSLMQRLTDGENRVEIEGATVRQIINNLDARYPGLKDRLVENKPGQAERLGGHRRRGDDARHVGEGEREQRGPLPARHRGRRTSPPSLRRAQARSNLPPEGEAISR